MCILYERCVTRSLIELLVAVVDFLQVVFLEAQQSCIVARGEKLKGSMRRCLLLLILCTCMRRSVVRGDITFEETEVGCDGDKLFVRNDKKEMKRVFLPFCRSGYKVIHAATAVFNVYFPYGVRIFESYSTKLELADGMQYMDMRMKADKRSRCVTRTTCYKQDQSVREFHNLKKTTASMKKDANLLGKVFDEIDILYDELNGTRRESRLVDGFLLFWILCLLFCAICGVASVVKAKFFMDKFCRKLSKCVAAIKEDGPEERVSAAVRV